MLVTEFMFQFTGITGDLSLGKNEKAVISLCWDGFRSDAGKVAESGVPSLVC